MRYSEEELRKKLQLYFVMGSNNCLKDPEIVLQEAIEGGITFFQFREKGTHAKKGSEKIKLAKKLQAICKQNGIPFIVNDDLELALEIDADGIHIGQEDEDPLKVRKMIGDKLLGISVHNLNEANQALAQGANYLGVGPMYETTTKKDIREVKGPEVIVELRENNLTVPIVGIGGIQKGLIKPVIEAGADGVAVISAISNSENPREAVKDLLEEMK
ncbi:thiamine phosphate synthase [Schinkia azotoformans]|uniref:thiamine phosphate synthase n=1 Tax=Schinkia azotoformans TaxID=1454 RepID=UPI002DB88B6D|nr:thiamine phosphate synthase [Schinkia azotoformans]MEC1720938.1 thiamine phosphate synthase [Schinkia azotoformans]MED4412189.1 thiamine phosphate synthase [Schinkia azotoformans]